MRLCACDRSRSEAKTGRRAEEVLLHNARCRAISGRVVRTRFCSGHVSIRTESRPAANREVRSLRDRHAFQSELVQVESISTMLVCS